MNQQRTRTEVVWSELRAMFRREPLDEAPVPLTPAETAQLVAKALSRVSRDVAQRQPAWPAHEPAVSGPAWLTRMASWFGAPRAALAFATLSCVLWFVSAPSYTVPTRVLPDYDLRLLSSEHSERAASQRPSPERRSSPARFSYGSAVKVAFYPSRPYTDPVTLQVTAVGPDGAALSWRPNVELAPDGKLLASGVLGGELGFVSGTIVTEWRVASHDGRERSAPRVLQFELVR